MVQARIDLLKLFEPPELNQEDVRKMLRSVIIANPTAPKLTTEVSVRFPTKDGSRTDVQMMLLVPRAELSPAVAGAAEVYTIDVTGEVLRDGQLWEKYRYRFDFPVGADHGQVPDRHRSPAAAGGVRVARESDGREHRRRGGSRDAARRAGDLHRGNGSPESLGSSVPRSASGVTNTEEPRNPRSPEELAPGTIAELKNEIVTKEPRLRIVPPSGDFVSGLQTIDTIATGDGIKARRVLDWTAASWPCAARRRSRSISISATVPQMRRIRAVALDEQRPDADRRRASPSTPAPIRSACASSRRAWRRICRE